MKNLKFITKFIFTVSLIAGVSLFGSEEKKREASAFENNNADKCPICLSPFDQQNPNAVTVSCKSSTIHGLHNDCLVDHLEKGLKKQQCTICRDPFSELYLTQQKVTVPVGRYLNQRGPGNNHAQVGELQFKLDRERATNRLYKLCAGYAFLLWLAKDKLSSDQAGVLAALMVWTAGLNHLHPFFKHKRGTPYEIMSAFFPALGMLAIDMLSIDQVRFLFKEFGTTIKRLSQKLPTDRLALLVSSVSALVSSVSTLKFLNRNPQQ